MYRLLIVDIDGTLLNSRLEITRRTYQAIKAAQRQGVMITLATGRSFHSALQYAEKLELAVPMICANGGLIRHQNGDVIEERLLPPQMTADLVEEMIAAGLLVQAYCRDSISYRSRLPLWPWLDIVRDKSVLTNFFFAAREIKQSRMQNFPCLADSIRTGSVQPHKVFATTGKDPALEAMACRCRERGFKVAFYPGYNDRMYLEIMAPGTSKGVALRRLAAWLKVGLEQVVAVGDNLNDTEMIKAAGLGVAMGNGHDGLKKLADHTTLSNDQDGVAAVIRDFLLTADRAALSDSAG